MATSLLALLDDVATILDDVSVMTKVAAKKTAGVLGDDLALNAQQVAGVRADRELPVVWAVAKGSLLNKAILVPAALAISAFAPWLVTPLLMIGGAFLCYEGFEKLAHRFLHSRRGGRRARGRARRGAGRPGGRPGGAGEGQDQGRDPHRLRPLGRDHRDHPRHGGDASRSATQFAVLVAHRPDHDGGRLRLRRRIVKLDDGGPGSQPPRRRVLARRWAGRSSPARRT